MLPHLEDEIKNAAATITNGKKSRDERIADAVNNEAQGLRVSYLAEGPHLVPWDTDKPYNVQQTIKAAQDIAKNPEYKNAEEIAFKAYKAMDTMEKDLYKQYIDKPVNWDSPNRRVVESQNVELSAADAKRYDEAHLLAEQTGEKLSDIGAKLIKKAVDNKQVLPQDSFNVQQALTVTDPVNEMLAEEFVRGAAAMKKHHDAKEKPNHR